MNARLGFCVTAALLAFGVSSGPLHAQSANSESREAVAASATSVPRLVQFNGTLKDTSAHPLSGVTSVSFAIYDEQDGGSPLWTETQNVLADANGHFTALLGTATTGGFPSELFSAGAGASRWLGVTVARSAEMPRVLLASVPYAMKAGDADTLGGLPASSYVTTSQLAARGAVAVPATTIVSSLSTASGTTSNALVGSTDASTQSVTQATITGTGTAQFLPLWTSGTNLGNSKIFQAAGGFIGINTTTPLLQLDVNGNSIFRGSFQMAPQGTATAGAGQPSHSFQWQASLFNSSTNAAVNEAFGFRTVPDQNDVANPTAKLDLFYGPGGGTLNDTGLSINHSGIVTFLPAQTFSGASVSVNTLTLPGTNGTSTGVLTIGGAPAIAEYGGSSNLFLGAISGNPSSSNTGTENVAVGNDSMLSVTTGGDNTAVGANALFNNTTGSDNTAVGNGALSTVKTSAFDTAVGEGAGQGDTNGGNNTYIGATSGPLSAGLTNATAIGYGAKVNESGALVLGGVGVNVGIGTSQPGNILNVVDPGAFYASPNLALFQSDQPNRNVVYATNTATTGNAAAGFFSSNGPTGYAIEAINQNAGAYAGYFFGNVHVAGTLSKTAGSFKIDDPIDPAGKYLSHSFVESPDMMNIYNGIATLDAHGAATITMPAWFSALNKDFRYQLTALGNAAPKLHVAEEMRGDQFRIAGGKKGMRVSWMVTGIRHDAYADAHRIPTEEEKTGDEQGKYLNPELFGAGPEKAIGRAGAASVEAKTGVAPSTAKNGAAGRD